ncbi:MAG: S41 family peptidase, partial [Burkholderiales bacterium]
APIEDTPAARAGVRAGDLIIKIDEKPTKGMSLSEAVKLMRGKPKTSITLTISRKGTPQPLVITIVRDIIRVQSVRSKILEPGIGYLRITQFQEKTIENLVSHLLKLDAESRLEKLVLDLRNDPGGLLYGAVGVSAAFLPKDALVVSTNGRTEDARRKYFATPEDYVRGRREDLLDRLPQSIKSIPMVVLVNGGSASASEIVAGALQDHRRAVVLGTQTFGKGSVQTILPLSRTTAIKLTTARYYTPSGRSIQAKGIAPDYLVEETPEGDVNRFRVREADLSGHLASESGTETRSQPQPGQEDTPPALRQIVFGSEDDHQLQQALNFLKGRPVAVAKTEAAAAASDTTTTR